MRAILFPKGSDYSVKNGKRKEVAAPDVPGIYDPMGSYTGLPRDPFERPVQDADDLQ